MVILMAAGKLPLAKPVQEIVMPLVGSKAASNKPKANSGCCAKNIRPSAYATIGINKKLTASAHNCTALSPATKSCLGLIPTIIGYTIKMVNGAIKSRILSVGIVSPATKPSSKNRGMLMLRFLLNQVMYFILSSAVHSCRCQNCTMPINRDI